MFHIDAVPAFGSRCQKLSFFVLIADRIRKFVICQKHYWYLNVAMEKIARSPTMSRGNQKE